jgi:hypothetical protein
MSDLIPWARSLARAMAYADVQTMDKMAAYREFGARMARQDFEKRAIFGFGAKAATKAATKPMVNWGGRFLGMQGAPTNRAMLGLGIMGTGAAGYGYYKTRPQVYTQG